MAIAALAFYRASAVDIVFAQNPLDRASERRRDRAWLRGLVEAEESRYLVFWRLQALLRTGEPPGIAWANTDIRENMIRTTGPILLGLRDGIAHFVVDVSGLEKPERELGVAGQAQFGDVRAAASLLAADDAAILAQGRAMVGWHANHRYCGKCGETTRPRDAGYARVCEDCDAEHFPRTDPVVIMLVVRDDRCLLGRQEGWPLGMYSALAGFVEPGETIEEAVRREVSEEAGIEVGEVRYLASQPWPFPSSLMIGCHADGLSERVVVDPSELEDARWFGKEQIRKALAGGGGADRLWVPPPMAIAHQLVRAWAEQD